MIRSKILPIVVVPLLLAIAALGAYITITNNWNLELASFVIFLITAFYVIAFEHTIPLKHNWKTKKTDLLTDFKHLFLSALIFDAIGKAAVLSAILWWQKQFFEMRPLWNEVPMAVSFVLALIIGELLPYFYHKISHEGKRSYLSMFLWKIHSIHHIPKSLNYFKTNWIHPLNMFMNTVLKLLPLMLIGFSSDIIFLVGVTHVVVAYISHANIKSKTGVLDYLIVTPSIHHFHHSKVIDEAKNFGNIIPFWDLVFGTYYNRKGEVAGVGVVESHLKYPEGEKYFDQMFFPFKGLTKDCCSDKLAKPL